MSDPIDAGYYEIDPAGDLMIKVYEYDFTTTNGRGSHLVVKTVLMKVSREVLMNNSIYFTKLLGGQFKEASSNLVELHEDTVQSIELWFRVLHGNIDDGSYLIERKEIWEAIWLTRKYFFHIEKLNAWFATYWSRLDKKQLEIDDHKELLYPAQAFDHPVAFSYITKTMAHTGTGHIEEHNPTRHWQLHVEGRVIQQLNAAKGSMRKEILKGLFDHLNNFCTTDCLVKEKSLWAYIEGVKTTGIWPLDSMHARSNESIVESPGFLRWKCDIPEGACTSCTSKLRGRHISETRTKIINYWDGLCLDCRDDSAPKTGDLDADYWMHNKLKRWDRGCRIKHERNTWYFSFMGRPEIMNSFKKEQQERKRKRERRSSGSD
ncbi:hypothetical protein N431DRAFT_442268 [Stipitochalara longipes BDJ]|nr:hypothetical protein N431DRAFT_442268 [Stipitochalara longipes BDJ]